MPMHPGLIAGQYLEYMSGGFQAAGSTGSSISKTIDVPTGCDLMVVAVALQDSNGNVQCSSVDFASSFPLTKDVEVTMTASRWGLSLWSLRNPPPSTNLLAATFSGAVDRMKGMTYLFFKNSRAGKDVGSGSGNSSGSAITNTLTTTKRGIMVSAYNTSAGNTSAENGVFSGKVTSIDFQDDITSGSGRREFGIGHSALVNPGSNAATYTPSNSTQLTVASALYY